MSACDESGIAMRTLLESRLCYHVRCFREDATHPTMDASERLALVGDWAARVRSVRRELMVAR